MSFRKLIYTAIALGFSGAAAVALAAEADCAGCHDVAPVPDGHMEVEEISAESCAMCHEPDVSDPFFTTIHEVHGESLGCDTCHEDAGPEREALLEEMLSE